MWYNITLFQTFSKFKILFSILCHYFSGIFCTFQKILLDSWQLFFEFNQSLTLEIAFVAKNLRRGICFCIIMCLVVSFYTDHLALILSVNQVVSWYEKKLFLPFINPKKSAETNSRFPHSLVVTNLQLEAKCPRFQASCQLCAKVVLCSNFLANV